MVVGLDLGMGGAAGTAAPPTTASAPTFIPVSAAAAPSPSPAACAAAAAASAAPEPLVALLARDPAFHGAVQARDARGAAAAAVLAVRHGWHAFAAAFDGPHQAQAAATQRPLHQAHEHSLGHHHVHIGPPGMPPAALIQPGGGTAAGTTGGGSGGANAGGGFATGAAAAAALRGGLFPPVPGNLDHLIAGAQPMGLAGGGGGAGGGAVGRVPSGGGMIPVSAAAGAAGAGGAGAGAGVGAPLPPLPPGPAPRLRDVLKQVRRELTQLEENVPWSAVSASWKGARRAWQRRLRAADGVPDLAACAAELAAALLVDRSSPSSLFFPGGQWERALRQCAEGVGPGGGSTGHLQLAAVWEAMRSHLNAWLQAGGRPSTAPPVAPPAPLPPPHHHHHSHHSHHQHAQQQQQQQQQQHYAPGHPPLPPPRPDLLLAPPPPGVGVGAPGPLSGARLASPPAPADPGPPARVAARAARAYGALCEAAARGPDFLAQVPLEHALADSRELLALQRLLQKDHARAAARLNALAEWARGGEEDDGGGGGGGEEAGAAAGGDRQQLAPPHPPAPKRPRPAPPAGSIDAAGADAASAAPGGRTIDEALADLAAGRQVAAAAAAAAAAPGDDERGNGGGGGALDGLTAPISAGSGLLGGVFSLNPRQKHLQDKDKDPLTRATEQHLAFGGVGGVAADGGGDGQDPGTDA
jgi:hypothetical protein